MDNTKRRSKKIKNDLRGLNKRAKRFMKPYTTNSQTWKLGYDYLVESKIWKSAKQLLLQYKLLVSPNLVCYFCNQVLRPTTSVLHHKKYNRRKYFKPAYVTFVHYNCHSTFHTSKKGLYLSRYMRNRLILIIILVLVVIFFSVFY